MKITHLTIENFESAKICSVAFENLNVVTGKNAKGKTAILRGTKVGLIGYDPSLGKTKLAKLANGNMSVRLETTEGVNAWSWKRTKTGLSAVAPQPNPIDIASTLLDFRTFLNKSGPQQVAYVIEQTDLDKIGFSRDALTAEIKAVKPEQPTEQTEAATKLIIADIQKADEEAKEANANTAGWLEILFTKLSNRLKLAKQEVARLAGSVQTGVKLATDKVVRLKVEIDREITSVNSEISTLESEKAVLNEQRTKYEANKKRREELQNVGSAQAEAEELAKLSQESNQLTSAIAKLKGPTPEQLTQLTAASNKHTTAKNRLTELENRTNELTGELEALEKRAACPCCGNSGLACSANERTRGELQAKLDEAQRQLLQAQTDEEIADREHISIASVYNDAVTQDYEIKDKQKRITEINTKIEALNKAILKSANAAGELAGLESVAEPGAMTDATIATIESKVAALRLKLSGLNQEQSEATAAAAAKLRRNQEVEKQAIAEAELEITRLALGEVEKKKDLLVADSMKKLLEVAQKFAANIIEGVLAWENDELGIRRGSQWISHEVFSGTESAVAYIGVAVSLCQSSKFKLVLMDELGVVDDENIGTLLTNLDGLIKTGVIDQFVGADVRHERYASMNIDGLNLIKV